MHNSISADSPVAERNVEMLSTSGQPPDWIWQVDHPYVHGVFAPVDSELELTELPISGELPADLQGCYVVNSPNQRWKPQGKYHYYDGDGMLHAVYFRDGRAHYTGRWVRTDAFVREEAEGAAVWPDQR